MEGATTTRYIEREEIDPRIRRSKELLELIENHKSHWIPGSKGGEPNCRRE